MQRDNIKIRVISPSGVELHRAAYIAFRGLALPAVYQLAMRYPECAIEVERVGGELSAQERRRVADAIAFVRREVA